jgi:hypothetical protein
VRRPNKELSPKLLSAILRQWFGEGDPLAEEMEQQQRIDDCRKATRIVAYEVKKQLCACGRWSPQEWNRQRPMVVGYVHGLAEAVVRGNGESSRWPVTLVFMTSLLTLMDSDWDEDVLIAESSRYLEARDADYLRGIATATKDYGTMRAGKTVYGLAAQLIA